MQTLMINTARSLLPAVVLWKSRANRISLGVGLSSFSQNIHATSLYHINPSAWTTHNAQPRLYAPLPKQKLLVKTEKK